jgi:hypothetical protein
MSIHLGVLIVYRRKFRMDSLRTRSLRRSAQSRRIPARAETFRIDELEAFVSLTVALKTGGLQRPTVDRDNINQRFGFPLLH